MDSFSILEAMRLNVEILDLILTLGACNTKTTATNMGILGISSVKPKLTHLGR